MAAIIEAIIAIGVWLARVLPTLFALIKNIPQLLSNIGIYFVSLLPALVAYFIDELFAKFESLLKKMFDDLSGKIDDIPDTPFPDIPTLSDTYNALDPLVRNYLDLFRVREALAIIAAVAIWR